MATYKYGASYNCSSSCSADGFDIGGGGEGDTTVDYVSNDLEKLEEALLGNAREYEPDEPWVASRDHEYVGKGVDVGGKIVSVICYPWNSDDPTDTYDLCVVYEAGKGPVVIE